MGYAAQTAKTLALSRQKVFAHLVDFGGVGKLLPDDVESVQLRGEGIGSVRSIRLKGADGALEERLEAAVDEHVMSYSLIVNTVLPVENYTPWSCSPTRRAADVTSSGAATGLPKAHPRPKSAPCWKGSTESSSTASNASVSGAEPLCCASAAAAQ